MSSMREAYEPPLSPAPKRRRWLALWLMVMALLIAGGAFAYSGASVQKRAQMLNGPNRFPIEREDRSTIGMPVEALPNPGLPNPGLPNPGLANPGLANPGLGDPGLGDPGLGDPGATNPGSPAP